MALVKLTGPSGIQRGLRWVVGETVVIPPEERDHLLCSAGLLHVYEGETVEEALALGLTLNPIHADIDPSQIEAWEVEGEVVARDATKAAGYKFLVCRQIQVPAVTTKQRVEIAIRCAMAVYHEPNWVGWADGWLGGNTSEAAAAVAEAEAVAAAAEAAVWAARAAEAAEVAAKAVVWSAEVEEEGWAAIWAAAEAAARAAEVEKASVCRIAAQVIY